ncbi:MAG: peptide deformylase [Phycisphaerales bacterium]|nr:peptide deformylase [Phycisphaerales bacterium]
MSGPSSLRIIHYPDSRLRARSAPVERFDAGLRELAAQMFSLMRESKGVGLAAPQVGVLLRMFVMNATGQPDDDRVLINPVIDEMEGSAQATEGCLSIPGVNVQIRRPVACRIIAQDLAGERVELRGRDLVARIWQHETDHLNGVLILDRMGPTDRVATKKVLRALEDPVR